MKQHLSLAYFFHPNLFVIMKTISCSSLLLAGLLFFASCANDNKSASANTGSSAEAPTAAPAPGASSTDIGAEKPEFYLHAAAVDKLLMREEPSQKSTKVVYKIAKGELLEGNGEVSDNIETAMLSGIEIEAPFYRVNSTTPDKKTGWVFGGALRTVYAGPKSGSPDQARVAMLAKTLASFKLTELSSGQKAWDYVRKNFSDANGALADAAFMLLEQHIRSMVFDGNFYNMTERVQWADTDYNKVSAGSFDMNSTPVTRQLAAAGMSLGTAEGMIFPTVDYKRLQDFFGNKLTPAMREYLAQTTKEEADPMYDDGGIMIPLETVAERAFFWEQFNKKYPWFVRREETANSERWAGTALLCGADNTPIYDFESEKINEDHKNAWKSVLSKYPGSTLATDTKAFYDLCEAEAWKMTPKVRAWMEERNQVE